MADVIDSEGAENRRLPEDLIHDKLEAMQREEEEESMETDN
jgi:hypothetical protein